MKITVKKCKRKERLHGAIARRVVPSARVRLRRARRGRQAVRGREMQARQSGMRRQREASSGAAKSSARAERQGICERYTRQARESEESGARARTVRHMRYAVVARCRVWYARVAGRSAGESHRRWRERAAHGSGSMRRASACDSAHVREKMTVQECRAGVGIQRVEVRDMRHVAAARYRQCARQSCENAAARRYSSKRRCAAAYAVERVRRSR